jgi:hypothetical protein
LAFDALVGEIGAEQIDFDHAAELVIAVILNHRVCPSNARAVDQNVDTAQCGLGCLCGCLNRCIIADVTAKGLHRPKAGKLCHRLVVQITIDVPKRHRCA